MALLEDVSESITETPLLWIAIGVAALSAPRIITAGRPLIKGAIKGVMALKEKGREVVAESKERLQDVYEEAKYEYSEAQHEGEAEAAPVTHAEKSTRRARAAVHPATEGEGA